MLETRAVIQRKNPWVEADWCQIEKVIEISGDDFEEFQYNLMNDYDFIKENIGKMWLDEDDISHCLLVLGEEQPDGILVRSEGASYARYYAFMPHAREYLEREMDKMIAHFIEDISPSSDRNVSISLRDIDEYTGATFEISGAAGKLFVEALNRNHHICESMAVSDGFVLTLAAVHEANIQMELQRKCEVLRKTLNTLSEHFSGSELYDMLHECCGMSNEEITDEGFDLEKYFEIEAECSPQITM